MLRKNLFLSCLLVGFLFNSSEVIINYSMMNSTLTLECHGNVFAKEALPGDNGGGGGDPCAPYLCINTGPAPGYHGFQNPDCYLYVIGARTNKDCIWTSQVIVCGPNSKNYCDYWK